VNGYLFITPGAITQLRAHAIAYSASSYLSPDGSLYSSFQTQVPGFAAWFAELREQPNLAPQVGDTFWMPLRPEHPPHGVVVVVSTGGGPTTEDKAALAVRAALRTATERLRALGKTERLLIALPAFRVGKGGDRQHVLRSALAQVKAALDTLADLDNVDAVFITYTPTVYQVFLEARRQALSPPAAVPLRYPALEVALQARECVLFVGAGLSRGTGLPDWGQLIDQLAGELGLDHKGLDYLDLAQWYRERFGPDRLADVIRRTFSDPRHAPLPTLSQYLLMSLPIRHVLTTNYDELLEQTLTALKRYPIKVVHQADVARTGQGEGVYVVKLHGDAAAPEEVVLSRDDYDEFFHRRPAMALLLEGLLLNQTFFFVGYSLRDPNFRQIYSRIARMLRDAARPAFATSFELSGDKGFYLAEQWRKKQLQLIGIPGATQEEQEQQFVRFLDGLAERVALEAPRLFLAPDVAASPPLARLRKLLVEDVARELVIVCRNQLTGPNAAGDVRYLAQVLAFLNDQSWRPEPRHGSDLCRLWEKLAAAANDPREQRRLLIAALACTEAFADVERLHRKLRELDKR